MNHFRISFTRTQRTQDQFTLTHGHTTIVGDNITIITRFIKIDHTIATMDANNGYRYQTVPNNVTAQLSLKIVTPTVHTFIGAQRTSMSLPNTNNNDRIKYLDHCEYHTYKTATGTELP